MSLRKNNDAFMKGRIAVALVLLSTVIASGFVSCKKADENARRYPLKGKVISVDTKNGFVEVDHEAIPGFMAAMTMPYPVPDTRTLATLAAGDEITAEVVLTSQGAHLENIIVTKKSDTGKAPPKG
jgi:protein SCO1/2